MRLGRRRHKERLSEREHRGQTEGWQKIGLKTQGVGLTEAWVSTGLLSLEAECAAGDCPFIALK